MLLDGERQVAPVLEGIRRDHVARYTWAARVLRGHWIVDVACGVGYGSHYLASHGYKVISIDRDAEAIEYAREHYQHERIEYRCEDAADLKPLGELSAAVCFETIEHLEDPRPLLRALHGSATQLLASVPNEDEFPYLGYAFHFRHYTRAQFESLLNECGWIVQSWHGQEGPESDVEDGAAGRTIIANCSKGKIPERVEVAAAETDDIADVCALSDEPPAHVAILGLGPSLAQYLDITKRLGGKHAFCDETWGINAAAGTLMCDRVFHMDDVRIQEIRAQAAPESNIARMLEWLKVHPGPIVTSRPHPDYPGLVAFPLQAVINDLKHAYFNSTAAYAVAYAIHIGVKKISLFGVDYTYPNAHDAEKGRACVEFLLGIAAARGIRISIPKASSLMDALHTQAERLYGYDTVSVTLHDEQGRCRVEMSELQTLPSAEEIEARYDHSCHPSPLMQSQERTQS